MRESTQRLGTVALVLVALLACKQQSGGGSSPAKRELIAVGPTEVTEAYRSNQVAADAKYKGKRLSVAGYVSGVTNGLLGGVDVALVPTASARFSTLRCNFSESSERLGSLKVGEVVTVEGDCDGGTTLGVTLNKCAFK